MPPPIILTVTAMPLAFQATPLKLLSFKWKPLFALRLHFAAPYLIYCPFLMLSGPDHLFCGENALCPNKAYPWMGNKE